MTLQSLYPGLNVGGHVIVDDYGALEECRRAVDEFRDRHGIEEPLEQVDWTCVAWRRESEGTIEPVEPPRASKAERAQRTVRAVPRERDLRVPSEHELLLSQELDRLKRRPLAAPLHWVKTRLRHLRGR